jgi:hypothetical protein
MRPSFWQFLTACSLALLCTAQDWRSETPRLKWEARPLNITEANELLRMVCPDGVKEGPLGGKPSGVGWRNPPSVLGRYASAYTLRGQLAPGLVQERSHMPLLPQSRTRSLTA